MTPARPRKFIKSVQNNRKRNKFIKLFLIIVLFFLFLNLGFQIPKFVKVINSPFKSFPASTSNKNRVDMDFRTNILLASINDKNELVSLNIISFDPVENKFLFIAVPTEKFRDKFSSNNLDPLVNSVKRTLYVPVDGYFIFDTGNVINEELVAKARDELFSFRFLTNLIVNKEFADSHIRTNLRLSQFFKVAWRFKKARDDKIDFMTLRDLTSFSIEKVGEALVDSKILSENTSVEIKTTSSSLKAGWELKQIINNLGASVILTNSNEEVDKTTIYVLDEKQNTLRRLKSVVNGEVLEAKDVSSVADIVVVLGKSEEAF